MSLFNANLAITRSYTTALKYFKVATSSITSNASSLRFCSKPNENFGQQMGGFEYKEEIQPFRSKWRTPFSERTGYARSHLDLFRSMKFQANLTTYNPANYKYWSWRRWLGIISKNKLIFDQRFVEERLSILGSNLAAAHFLVYRGGAVKFSHSGWIRDYKNKKDYDVDIPNTYDSEFKVEALDFTGVNIQYEGLVNFENLCELRWLSFDKCISFDNWCLDRITGEHGNKLEYLDLSHTRVTFHGLQALYRCENLTTLKVHGLHQDSEFLQVCLQLQKCLPNLSIEGISTDILEGQSNNPQLEDQRDLTPKEARA